MTRQQLAEVALFPAASNSSTTLFDNFQPKYLGVRNKYVTFAM